jgi:hypothetical protein
MSGENGNSFISETGFIAAVLKGFLSTFYGI